MIEFKLLKQLTEAFPIGFSDEKRRQVNPMTGKDSSPSDVKKEIIKDLEAVPKEFIGVESNEIAAKSNRWWKEVQLRVKRYNLDNPKSGLEIKLKRPAKFRNILLAYYGADISFSTFDLDTGEVSWHIPSNEDPNKKQKSVAELWAAGKK